ncbi:LysE family translocator [Shumkonia mesophila]|uniref:LysE family translocator n=1 Tax=Shumkonia mesophila TaxID=2838854 RepID=UPI0029340F11|nr:LysE family translocator [Shumkonia mesophila]
MISGHDLMIFLGASILLNLSPGPDTLYVLTRTLAQGRRIGFLSSFGVCTGALVHVAAAALGLSVVLATSAVAFTVVKVAGAAYLVYLGARMLLSRDGIAVEAGRPVAPASGWKVFRQGILIDVLNPKAALFFMAFLPQFVVPGTGHATAQFFALGLIVIAIALVWEGILVLFATLLSARLRANQAVSRWLNRTLGGVFVALGIRLALERN